MKKIWKYELQQASVQQIMMPVGAKILYTGVQFGHAMCVWALVNPENDLVEREVRIYGTGHDVPDATTERQYYGTVLLENDSLVFHIFIGG